MASDTHAAAHGHHGPVQHQFDDLEQQRESITLGMWLFLATEVMMFGGLFLAYAIYRWKIPGAFDFGSDMLNDPLGFWNTGVLLVSSLTMALAVYHASNGKTRPMLGMLFFTAALGITFLVIKTFEWSHDWDIGLIPGLKWTYFNDPNHLHALEAYGTHPHQVLMFFVVYFCMTGLHAIHMIIGLGAVGYFMYLGRKGQFEKGNDQPVEILGLYWHLIDIIWIFLFPLLYLITSFQWSGGGGGH